MPPLKAHLSAAARIHTGQQQHRQINALLNAHQEKASTLMSLCKKESQVKSEKTAFSQEKST